MAGGALAPTLVSSTSGASLLAVLLSHPNIAWHHVCTLVGAGTGQLGIPWYRLGLPKAHSGSQWSTCTVALSSGTVVHSGAQSGGGDADKHVDSLPPLFAPRTINPAQLALRTQCLCCLS